MNKCKLSQWIGIIVQHLKKCPQACAKIPFHCGFEGNQNNGNNYLINGSGLNLFSGINYILRPSFWYL